MVYTASASGTHAVLWYYTVSQYALSCNQMSRLLVDLWVQKYSIGYPMPRSTLSDAEAHVILIKINA